LSAALCAAMLLCSCSGGTEDSNLVQGEASLSPQASAGGEMTRLRIPYHAEDTLNPYTCATLQNYYAAGLLYDTLVALNTVGDPQNCLAQEITIEGASCIVKLRTDARFSDGSPVTAGDVIYSMETARQSTRFSAQLSGVLETSSPDNYTVVFLLAAPDQFFDRSLAFPIVKEGTGEEALPTGGGRFVAEEGGTLLKRNEAYYDPVDAVQTVELVDAGDLRDQGEAVVSGKLDLMYTDLQGEVDLSLGLPRRQVVLSNLVFLGINSQRWGFSNEVRCAFSGLINRDALIRKAYLGFGAAAYSPIKASYSSGSGTASETEVNLEKQNALLDSLGYDQRDQEGWRTLGGREFTLRLLVNSDNVDRTAAAKLVAQDFQAAGIRIQLEEAPFETYSQRIAAGDYDLYLGEIKIPWNLDLLSLISPDPQVGPGCVQDDELIKTYYEVKSGQADLEVLDAALGEVMPVIPLVYRRGIVCYSQDFSPNIVATEQDIFYNIGDW
jgi:peptide/nickel transport system substrate-binding protein